MKKSILSLILVFAMLLGVCPVAMADDASATITIQPSADAWISGGEMYSQGNYLRLTGRSAEQTPYWSRGSVCALAYDVTDVFNTLASDISYVIQSVKFKPAKKKSLTDSANDLVSNMKLNFWPLTTKWDDASGQEGYQEITTSNMYSITRTGKDNNNYITFDTSYALTLDSGSDLVSEYDITSLFKSHMDNYKDTDLQNFFSFGIHMTCTQSSSTGYAEAEFYSGEYGDGAEIVVTYGKPEEVNPLAVDETNTILPSSPDDVAVVAFNNSLESATVKINDSEISDSYITISEEKVTVDYPFEKFSTYSIEVFATDSNGSSTTYADSFSTTYAAQKNEAVAASASHVTSSGSATVAGMGADARYYSSGHTSNSFVLYGFTLPEKPSGGYIEKATFEFWATTPAVGEYKRAYKFPAELNTSDVTASSDTVKSILDNHAENKAGETTLKSRTTVNSDSYYRIEVDITGYVNELLGAGKTGTAYVAIAAYSDTCKFLRITPDSSISGSLSKPALTTIVNLDPTILAKDVSYSVSGDTLTSLSFGMYTVFDKNTLEAALSLVDDSGNTVSDAGFVYDSINNKVALSSGVKLEEEKEYFVVIAEGTSDLFEQTVDETNSHICAFQTQVNYEISGPVYVDGDIEVSSDASDFDALSTIDNPFSVQTVKAAAKVVNNSSENLTPWIIVASYNDNNELISIATGTKWIRYRDSAVVSTSAISAQGAATIKAFVWNYSDTINPLADTYTIDATR